MALSRLALTAQHDRESQRLTYGHFGTATYNGSSHKWLFTRQHGLLPFSPERQNVAGSEKHLSLFQLLDERTTIVVPRGDEEIQQTGAVSLRGNIRNTLLKFTPDAIDAVADLLPNSGPARNPQRRSARDGAGTDVLSFGSAIRLDTEGGRSNSRDVPVAAFCNRVSQGTVYFARVVAETTVLRSRMEQDRTCRTPFLDSSSVTAWTHSSEEVQQLSFSHDQTYLIVQQESSTSILWLFLDPNSGSIAPKISSQSQSVGSTLHAKQIVTIPSIRTGGHPHCDAAFNHLDRNLVAIVDTRGTWSVWKIRGKPGHISRNLSLVALQSSGNIHQRLSSAGFDIKNSDFEEGHRICWLCSREGVCDRLLVCNSRVAVVFGSNGDLYGPVNTRVGPNSESNQILDIKSCRTGPCSCIVLTTSRLLIYGSSRMQGGDGLELLCSWNHFRSQGDVSLRMSVCESHRRIFVLLWSRMHSVMTCYVFGLEKHETLVSLADPSYFPMPLCFKESMTRVLDLVFCLTEVEFINEATGQPSHTLFKLVASLDDGTVLEALYESNETILDPGTDTIPAILLPRTKYNTSQSAKWVDKEGLDDFIVADGVNEAYHRTYSNPENSPRESSSSKTMGTRDWAKILAHQSLSAKAEAPGVEEGLRILSKGIVPQRLAQAFLLSDNLRHIHISDVDADASTLESWLQSIDLEPDIAVDQVGNHIAGTDADQGRGLLDVYNDMVETYVAPLSPLVTDRVRVNREKLARQVAVDAFLASLMVRVDENVTEAAATVQPTPTQDNDGGILGITEPELEEAEPPSSQPSMSQSPNMEEEVVLARLRGYANFAKASSTRTRKTPSIVTNVLAHIPTSIQDDPDAYSYREVNTLLFFNRAEADRAALDPRARRRAEKQAAVRQRKLDKQAKLREEVNSQRLLLPSVSVSIGGGLPGREVQSSQPAPPESSQAASQRESGMPGISMTQPERGAHGVRSIQKKGKKGRLAGF